MSGRERQDPDDRFAGDEHLFDLAASARERLRFALGEEGEQRMPQRDDRWRGDAEALAA